MVVAGYHVVELVKLRNRLLGWSGSVDRRDRIHYELLHRRHFISLSSRNICQPPMLIMCWLPRVYVEIAGSVCAWRIASGIEGALRGRYHPVSLASGACNSGFLLLEDFRLLNMTWFLLGDGDLGQISNHTLLHDLFRLQKPIGRWGVP